ncbi:MAG: enoyl-CoA hydratase [Myxococcota bacterium]
MTKDPVHTELDDLGIFTVTFNRPQKMNAFTYATYEGCVAALRRAEEESAVRCVILRGAGDAFTAGNDLQDFMQNPPSDEKNPIFQFLFSLVRFPKPLIGAVQGHAVGIGTTMLLHCDIVVASRSAKFRLPFVNLGLVPEGGSTVLLPQLCGAQKAAELLLLGQAFDGAQAHEFGLVNRLTDGAPFEMARELASQLAAQPLGAVMDAKHVMRAPFRAEVEAAIRREGAVFAQRLRSPEALEALQAFVEKRSPDFGRVTPTAVVSRTQNS